MQKQLNLSQLRKSFLNRFNRVVLAGTLLGIAAASVMPAIASSTEAKQTLQANTASKSDRLPDGVYLYGQSEKPDQIGQGYFVFEVSQGNVVGALYMPRSSFDCAAGQFQGDELALTVVNSYDRTTNPFEIALEKEATLAGGNPALQQVGLQGFERLATVTDNDRRMLKVCQSDFRQQAQRR